MCTLHRIDEPTLVDLLVPSRRAAQNRIGFRERDGRDRNVVLLCDRQCLVGLVGLSVLSGSHLPLVTEVVRRMRDAGIGEVPVVVGGIVPDEDAAKLRLAGVARIYTPKDFDVSRIMGELVELIEAGTSRAA